MKLNKIDKNNIIKIAVVGDVHDLWEDEDIIALELLEIDLVLFVGDFGNESVDIVKKIASIPLPKAVIMGNHDAWFSATEWGKKKCPYNPHLEDRVKQQLDILGEFQVGYSKLDFPQFKLSVVGSKPFSWGGGDWTCSDFFAKLYNVHNFEQSATKIMNMVEKTQFDHLLFLGHNGPFGLGNQAEDICGKDWNPIGGDFGDRDFQLAIAKSRELGKKIPLVTFGHMHHNLRHRQDRLRTIVNQDIHNTIYLNAAKVPRIQKTPEQQIRHFSIISLHNYQIEEILSVWIDTKNKKQTVTKIYKKILNN